MVISYIHIYIQKGSEGMLRMQQAGVQNRQIGRLRKQSRSTDSCAIHGFLCKVWIHRLRSAIHGLRRSTDILTNIYNLTIVEKSEFTDLIKGIFITEWLIIYQRFLSTFCEKDRARAV